MQPVWTVTELYYWQCRVNLFLALMLKRPLVVTAESSTSVHQLRTDVLLRFPSLVCVWAATFISPAGSFPVIHLPEITDWTCFAFRDPKLNVNLHLSQADVRSLSKKTSWSERRIQVWFRRRRNQDRPGLRKRFCEARCVCVCLRLDY